MRTARARHRATHALMLAARGNGTNYSIGAGNFRGTIVTTKAAMNAAGNANVNWSF